MKKSDQSIGWIIVLTILTLGGYMAYEYFKKNGFASVGKSLIPTNTNSTFIESNTKTRRDIFVNPEIKDKILDAKKPVTLERIKATNLIFVDKYAKPINGIWRVNGPTKEVLTGDTYIKTSKDTMSVLSLNRQFNLYEVIYKGRTCYFPASEITTTGTQ